MKKDKLYTIGKNLFLNGGLTIPGYENWAPTGFITGYETLNMSPKAGKPLSSGIINDVNKQIAQGMNPQKGSAMGSQIAGGIIESISPWLVNKVSGGYEGAGEAIASVGNQVSNYLPGPWKWAGKALSTGAGIIANLGWGVKANKGNIAKVNENTMQANAAGNALASATDTNSFMNAAQEMASTSGFGANDLYKNGRFTSKGTKKGKAALAKENAAIAFQNHGAMMGARGVDATQDSSVLGTFAAYGGPLGSLEDDNMGAINYGFMSDYLTAKQKQNDIKNKLSGMTSMPSFIQSFADGGEIHIKHPGRLTRLKERTGKTEAELWAEGNGGKLHKDGVSIPENVLCGGGKLFHGGGCLMPNMFDIGGDIQTNSADFTTGLTHVDAGGRHEENPYGGVQLGQDENLVPNLVEEGETIYNDYVYSNRITLDDEAKKAFHIGKKRDITYADLSKKLEKEASERPNDPISQSALKVQMQDLADQQERQKQEMEAQRARDTFEALSDKEKVAVMQQAAQQEQAAQQQAMQEQAMAEQQMMQESAAQSQGTSEQMAMMQQQAQGQAAVGQPEVMAEAPIMAYGGKVNKFAPGGNVNVGTWKEEYTNPWDVFTRPGLQAYMANAKARIDMAPEDKKAEVRKAIMDEFNALQQSYYDHVLFGSGESTYDYSDAIKNHQNMFNDMYGNTGFYQDDGNGNITNLVANAINLPKGHYTGDTPTNWADGYNGPQTSIRNFGSTIYGDDAYYADLVKGFQDLGYNYAPNKAWTYYDVSDKDKKNGYQLYSLSMPEAPQSATESPLNTALNNTPWGMAAGTAPSGSETPVQGGSTSTSPVATVSAPKKTGDVDEWEVTPNYRDENLRYAGLFGPAVGLGMQALGIGRPDTRALDGILEGYDKTGSAMADYMLIGDYLRYTPMNIWAEQNRLNANTRATDRALINNSAPVGTKAAGLLANEYNNQIGSGELYRKALEYNDALRERTASFNKDTNKFNAEAYNRAALQNAEVRNRDRQLRANLGMQTAQAKMDADAGWYNGIYGNVAGLFKGISDLGRENAQHNMIAEMAADGIFGPMSPRTNTGRRGKYLTFTKKSAAKGGKINKKKG